MRFLGFDLNPWFSSSEKNLFQNVAANFCGEFAKSFYKDQFCQHIFTYFHSWTRRREWKKKNRRRFKIPVFCRPFVHLVDPSFSTSLYFYQILLNLVRPFDLLLEEHLFFFFFSDIHFVQRTYLFFQQKTKNDQICNLNF